MRDPLHWMSVKYKLGLLFAGVCILAFGVGGVLVTTSAREVLEEEIRTRLDFHALACSKVLDREMALLTRRSEDFASDGFIRVAMAELRETPPGPDRDRVAIGLRDHLLVNKLPLVPAFFELTLYDPGGIEVLGTGGGGAPGSIAARKGPGKGLPAYTDLLPPDPGHPFPMLAVVVPVTELKGGRPVGLLAAWVRPEIWVSTALRGMHWPDPDPSQSVVLAIEDGARRRFVIPQSHFRDAPPESGAAASTLRGPAEPPPPPRARFGEAPFAASHLLETTGWRMHLSLQAPGAFARVESLQNRFLFLGVVLVGVASFFLFFPMRFLVRPILELREAALRIRAGDFGARVQEGTADEIGDLARSFNHMAEAVEERTERLRASAESLRARQVELRAEKDRIAAVVSSMRDGVLVLDADGEIVFSNAAARPLLDTLGSARAGVRAHYDCREGRTEGEDCAHCLLRPDGQPRSCVLDAGGRTLEIHSAWLPPGEDGRRGRVLVARDITGRLRQDEVHIHQERLAALGEVAAVMAHELNNPLTSISMFAQMIGESLPPEEPLREHVDVIRRNTESCKRAIRDLLGYATGSSPETGPVDVREVLDDVKRFVRPVAERSGARVRIAEGSPEAVVRGDEIQLRQLFVNLVINAIQAGGRGTTVTLTARVEGESLRVEVADDGPGIPEEIRGRIFDPFFTTKPREIGTGLGLPTSRRIAELHGGGVELLASTPEGTRFLVRLRLSPGESRAGLPAAAGAGRGE